MRVSPHVRVSFDMVCSKYKRAGIPIYRADLPGGSVWGFCFRTEDLREKAMARKNRDLACDSSN